MVPSTKSVSQNGYFQAKEKESKMKDDGRIIVEETKEAFPMQLGTYKASSVPMFVLFFGWTCGQLATMGLAKDPRMKGLPFMDEDYTIVILSILYILASVVWGPNLMKNRKPFNIRKIMIAYNMFQVAICSLMVIEVGLVGWFFDYNLYCQPVDFSWNPKPLRMTRVAYCFFLSKILDFVDTLFFVLNKKFSHISVLHVVHHSTMAMSMWAGIRFVPGGHLTLMGFVNGIVHIIMYSYYLLAALGPKYQKYLWWKKYLTSIQLGQFILVGLHTAQLLFHECPTIPTGMIYWLLIYAIIFLYLFGDFYHKAYLVKKNKGDAAPNLACMPGSISESANGHSKTGHNISSFRIDSCLRERQTTVAE